MKSTYGRNVAGMAGIAMACTLAMPAQAELQSRTGGFYDTVLDITWSQPSLAAFDNFGIPGLQPPYNAMTPQQASAWIAAVNAANYLGTNTWRLPHWPDSGVYGGCDGSFYDGGDCGSNVRTAAGSEYSELAHLWYVTLGNTSQYLTDGTNVGCPLAFPRACLVNTGPFPLLEQLIDPPSYLTDGTYDEIIGQTVFTFFTQFRINVGYQIPFSVGDANEYYVWAVADGDVLGGGPPVEKIAFVSNDDIYSMNGSGKAQRPLTRTLDPILDQDPTWSLDGTRIAFASRRGGPSLDIWVMNADGTSPTQLTFSGGNQQPTWSPGGNQIAFTTFRNGNPNIYKMDANGSNQTQITNVSDISPDWSPDGTKIAFVSSSDGAFNIYTVKPDGSGRTKLTNSVGSFNPDWSPDGTRIAYAKETGFQGDGANRVHVMNADGSNQIQLSNSGAREDQPSWSPDGTRIAFQSDRDDPALSFKKSEIYVMNADGSGQVRLTDLPGDTHSAVWQWPADLDSDSDGVDNLTDNCKLVANPVQCDSDGDGFGNRCDGDMNNNGFVNAQDSGLYRQQLSQPSVGPTYNKADLNCNGAVNAQDTALFRQLIALPPGP